MGGRLQTESLVAFAAEWVVALDRNTHSYRDCTSTNTFPSGSLNRASFMPHD
jgi:hypothetical protein